MEPEAEVEAPLSRPDPFAEAAITNGADSAPTRGPSLFERMIGRSPKQEEAREEPSINIRRTPVDQPEPKASSVFREADTSGSTAPVDREAYAPLTLKSLGGGDAAKTRAAEDQIDIPAFLRRQAN